MWYFPLRLLGSDFYHKVKHAKSAKCICFSSIGIGNGGGSVALPLAAKSEVLCHQSWSSYVIGLVPASLNYVTTSENITP